METGLDVGLDMGRSEKWQVQMKNRHRSDESGVHPGGSPFLQLTGSEMPKRLHA